jgi:hypothetical protein
MTADQARKERARLEAEWQNGVAAGARERNGKVVAQRAREKLMPELESARVRAVRQDGAPELLERIAELERELAALPTEAESEAAVDRANRAERDARTELEYLLKDELATFLADAAVLSEAAAGQRAALALPIAEARTTAQKAALEFAKLAPALAATLRERDEAAGTYAPAGLYQRLTRFPPFPIRVDDTEWTARPAGAALVTAKKAKVKAKVAA